jgi:tRNA(fMet)-specific endonuclease VapC
VKPVLLDTDVLSLYLRQGDPAIVDHCRRYIRQHGRLTLSILTYYEVVSGLRYRDARKQLDAFHRFVARNTVLPITEHSAALAAERYAQLRQRGTPVDDIDLLIAGIALEHGLVLVTRNRRHFDRIEGLTVADWSESETSGDAP